MRTRRHALGQNFLIDQTVIGKIIDQVSKDLTKTQTKTVLEIGPGRLALTKPLKKCTDENGARLILVERDKKLKEVILDELPEADLNFMDAASKDFDQFLTELCSNQKIYVASNLPYSASSQILANLCHHAHHLSGCTVMVQKELAQRMVAKKGSSKRGALSLLIQSYFDAKILFDVKPGAFNPPPKVMSSVLSLKPLTQSVMHGISAPLKFEKFCKHLFSQRRKMIRKILPKESHKFFPNLSILGTERPEELKLSTIVDLYQLVEENS